MSTLSPKKREIQEREEKILAAARPIIVREGYHALSMERIAEAVDYSRGTIYNHFSSKEDIIFALAEKGAAKRVEMFRAAASYKSISRFRILAICYMAERFVIKYPDFFLFEKIFKLDSVREKTSLERQQLIHQCELECLGIVCEVVRAAISDGDLTLPPEITPEQLVFGVWALAAGASDIAFTSHSLDRIGVNDPMSILRVHFARLFDGYLWRPLSSDYDAEQVFGDLREALESVL